MSIKSKTILLSLIVISILSLVGGVGIYAVNSLSRSIGLISESSLPAVRNMTLVDMMHDGIRATVYRSLIAGESEKEEIKEEFSTFSKDIRGYLTELTRLGLAPQVAEAVKKAQPNIEKFLKDAETVIQKAAAGEKEVAQSNLPVFIQSFEQLEKELEVIGDLIETEAKTSSSDSQAHALFLKTLSFYMVGAGIVISILISFLAFKFMNGLTLNLVGITENLRKETNLVVETSVSMAHVSGKLSEASTEQAASLQETVASIDEISAMVSRNADSALSSSKMSEQLASIAHQGKERTQKMVDSISDISSGNDEIIRQMQKSNSEISEIVRVIQDIGQKTQIINDIVFQTKLLSFNASVEAARAGEHGKGFAVVAEEVGNLASMSGKAATEITDMLTKSVKKVTDIVEGTKSLMGNLISQSKGKVDVGTETAKHCAQALNEILSNASSVNDMVKEISTASQEQSAGVREVNKAMSELDQVTQSNSITAEESSKAANDLKIRADKLNFLVLELTRIVGGKPVEAKKHNDDDLDKKVIPIKSAKAAVKVQMEKPKNKKVVGIDFQTPNSNDPRFEDV